MSESAVEKIVEEVLTELSEDDVGLWVLVRLLRAGDSQVDSVQLRLNTARICRSLSDRGVSIGDFDADGEFGYWPKESAIDRMLIAWSDLGRDPDIGEVAWLRLNTAQRKLS